MPLQYFLKLKDKELGPVPLEKIKKLFDRGEIKDTSLIRSAESSDWIAVGIFFHNLGPAKGLKLETRILKERPVEKKVFVPPPQFVSTTDQDLEKAEDCSEKSSQVSFDHQKINTWTLPIIIFLAVLIASSPASFLFDFIVQMPFHELGHSTIHLLGGQVAIPMPFVTIRGTMFSILGAIMGVLLLLHGHQQQKDKILKLGIVITLLFLLDLFLGGKRSHIVYLFLLFFFLYLGMLAKRHAGLPAQVALIIIILIQAYLSLILPEKPWEALMIKGGVGGEFVIPLAFIFAFYYNIFPPPWRWDVFRFLFIVPSVYSLVHSILIWHHYRAHPDQLPFGSALAGNDDANGDLNRLRDEFGMSETQMIDQFIHLGYICSIAVILIYCYHAFFKNQKANKITGNA
jgi:hypothetical protein